MKKRAAICTVLALWSIMFCLAAQPVVGEPRGPLGENEIRAIVDHAPDEEERPQAEALVLFDGTYISYEDAMTSVRRQRLVKIYTEYAIEELGDPRLAYDKKRQELEIHASRTYLVDGSTMDTPDNGYNEVTPFALDYSTEHLDIREMVVSHVGIERGVSILLDWTVRDTTPGRVPFNRLLLLLDEFPALEKEVVADGDLYGESVNPLASRFVIDGPEREAGRITWHWTDIPERPHHAGRRLGDQVPWIAIAAVPTWEDLLGVVAREAGMAAAPAERVESVIEDMDQEAAFIGEREFLERVTEAIADRTHLIRYHPWLFGLLPRDSDACMLSSTATPLERSVLTLSACRAHALDAELILPALWQTLSDRVPALEALGNPAVRVSGAEGTYYVDPVEGRVTTLEPVDGGMAYFAGACDWVDGGMARVTLKQAEVRANDIRLSVFWNLKTGEAKADLHMEGPSVAGLAWEEPGKALQDWAGGWTDSAEAGEVRVLGSSVEAMDFVVNLDAPLPSPDDRGRILLELPMPPLDVETLLPPGLDAVGSEIDGVLFPPAPAAAHLVWKVRLPEGYALIPGREREVMLEGGWFSVGRTVDGDLADVAYHFEWDGRPIRPEDYAGYRDLILDALDRRLTRLVLAEEESDE